MTTEAGAQLREVEALYADRGDDPSKHFQLGMAYLALGEPETGASHLRRFLDEEPGGPEAERAREVLGELEVERQK